jgi:hypothetical protein
VRNVTHWRASRREGRRSQEEEEMADTFVRPDVQSLGPVAAGSPWDERLLAYARAVRAMQDRPPREPASWAGQAALYRARPRGSWFFLPWLRMHLWYFERIVRAIVVADGGPRDWTLAFWGCSDGPPANATLPPAFAAPALPDGTPNPLYRPDGERPASLNAGAALPAAVTSAARALAARTFSPGLGGLPAGPGGRNEPRPPGLLEAQPHDSVAAALGPDTELDPVFALHLADVDRLWEAWLAQGAGRTNPVQFDWADQWFAFTDADGRARSLTCGQVGDLSNLDYAYTGLPARAGTERVVTADPDCPPIAHWPARGRRIATGACGVVELGLEPRRVALRSAAGPADPGRPLHAVGTGSRAAGSAKRVYLHLEDARAAPGRGSVWEVRVEGRPGGAASAASAVGDAAAVGTIAFPGNGDGARPFLFDITDAVGDPGAGGWDDEALAVSFHPALPVGFASQQPPAARVGRVFVTQA